MRCKYCIKMGGSMSDYQALLEFCTWTSKMWHLGRSEVEEARTVGPKGSARDRFAQILEVGPLRPSYVPHVLTNTCKLCIKVVLDLPAWQI